MQRRKEGRQKMKTLWLSATFEKIALVLLGASVFGPVWLLGASVGFTLGSVALYVFSGQRQVGKGAV